MSSAMLTGACAQEDLCENTLSLVQGREMILHQLVKQEADEGLTADTTSWLTYSSIMSCSYDSHSQSVLHLDHGVSNIREEIAGFLHLFLHLHLYVCA